MAEHKYAIATSGINPPVIYKIVNNEWTNISNSNDIEMQELVNLGNAYDANQAEIKALTDEIHKIRPYADCYKSICSALGIEKDVLGYIERLRAALEEIRDLEDSCCPRCEGNGLLYADGKAHLLIENATTIACGKCGGTGRILPVDARDIAEHGLKQ